MATPQSGFSHCVASERISGNIYEMLIFSYWKEIKLPANIYCLGISMSQVLDNNYIKKWELLSHPAKELMDRKV